MRVALIRIVCLLAALLISGVHWPLLQVVAWTGMLASYSRDYGWVQGLQKTFDGQNPCGLCKKVEEGQKKESQIPLIKWEKKADYWVEAKVLLLGPSRPVLGNINFRTRCLMGIERADGETPPPRV